LFRGELTSGEYEASIDSLPISPRPGIIGH
jgi:hypothetical protein